MTEALQTMATSRPAARITDWTVFKGLLWRQWLASRSLVLWGLGVWLAGLWALEFFFHPGFILAFGVIYAFLAGPMIGASEAAEGSEEFAFSLPPTRGMRYLANLVLAAGPLLVFTGIGVLAVAGDWPQALWRLVVDSGFTEPFPAEETTFVYPLAVAVPFGVLAFAFAIGSLAGARGLAAVSGLLGLLAGGAVLGAAFLVEALLWERLNGVISVSALFVLGAGALEAGYLLYIRKEGVSRPAPIGGRRLWWLWVLVAAMILLVLLMATLWVSRHSDIPYAEMAPVTEAGDPYSTAAPPRPFPGLAGSVTTQRPSPATSQSATSASAPAEGHPESKIPGD